MFDKGKCVLAIVLACILAAPLAGCGIVGRNVYSKQRAATATVRNTGSPDAVNPERAVSWSPGGNVRLLLGPDNNLYISDEKGERLIYRNYEKDKELFKHPYSLWSFDFFRIQWSDDGRYIYIIDSIYDVTNDKLIPLEDCLVFSWVGNRGVYLSGGKVVEGKFWDNGFYGFYASKCIKAFENGEVKTVKERTDDRYFIITESGWNETEKTLFRCLGPAFEVKTAKLKFSEEEMYERLIKAYQQLREDESAWELLNGKYREEDSRRKALKDFEKLPAKYPVRLKSGQFYGDRLDWDFDMNFYLVDIRADKLV